MRAPQCGIQPKRQKLCKSTTKMTLTRLARQRMSVGEPAYPSPTTRDKAYWRKYLGQIKIDFSKMPQKPVSEGFVFPKSIEQELAEARAKIAELEEAPTACSRGPAPAIHHDAGRRAGRGDRLVPQ